MRSMEERPWGFFRVLGSGEGFVVKELFVKEGGMTSLQLHRHREEYWVVVRGEGEVVVGESVKKVKEGDVVFVPRGVKHRIVGGKGGVTIVEVWKGDVLDENDIERLEDAYGRV